MTILQLIASENYISVNKDLIKLLGLEEAIMLGELASEQYYWQKENRLVEDAWFFSTIENIEENTGLSGHKQRKALKSLEDMGLIEQKIKGIPAKRYIRIIEEQVFNLFNSKSLKNLTTGCKKNEELDVKNFNGNKNNINNNNIKINNNIVPEDEKPDMENLYVDTKQQKNNNIINLYSEICTNLPSIKKINDTRKKALNKFAKEFTEDEIKQIFNLANSSEFLIGKNDRGWKADFDFILRTDKATAILEGKYSNKTCEPKQPIKALKVDTRTEEEYIREMYGNV